MYAELTIEINKSLKDFDNKIINFFQTQTKIESVIGFTIYRNQPELHTCFTHGYLSTDATLLFTTTGNEIKIHIECRGPQNSFGRLKHIVDVYFKQCKIFLSNNNSKIITQRVIINSEESYLLTGKITDSLDDFFSELKKQIYRIIFIPFTISIITVFFTPNDFAKSIVTFVGGVLGIIFWFLFELLARKYQDKFTYTFFE
jgi:hypothetical protein